MGLGQVMPITFSEFLPLKFKNNELGNLGKLNQFHFRFALQRLLRVITPFESK